MRSLRKKDHPQMNTDKHRYIKKNSTAPLLILLVVTFGCSSLRELGSKTRTGNSAASNSNVAAAPESKVGETAGTFAPSGDPKADIEKIADKFLSEDSFRAEMVGEGDMPMRTELEFVSPDRYRIKNANSTEMIVIGKTAYMNAGGQWRKMPMALDSTVTDMRAAFNKEGMKWFSDVRYEGEEMVDGKSAHVYAFHNKGPGAGVGENDSKIWVAKSDGRPLKIEAIYKQGTLKSMTIEYDYETPVVIEPPVK
jgi:hypothetical protein